MNRETVTALLLVSQSRLRRGTGILPAGLPGILLGFCFVEPAGRLFARRQDACATASTAQRFPHFAIACEISEESAVSEFRSPDFYQLDELGNQEH